MSKSARRFLFKDGVGAEVEQKDCRNQPDQLQQVATVYVDLA